MALKPPSGFCGLSRTRFSVGLVIKSAAPLREESVAVFKSQVAASEGPSLRGAWERPFKPQNWRLSLILQSEMDIVHCLSQGLNPGFASRSDPLVLTVVTGRERQ